MTTEPTFTEDEIAEDVAYYTALSEESLFQEVLPAFSTVLYEGALSGESRRATVERFYHDTFLPTLREAAGRNQASANSILEAIMRGSPTITGGLVALVGSFLVDYMHLPQPPERKLIIGLAAVLIRIAMDARREVE